ncbi:MAG: DUF2220 family protein [Micrococcales bacterium]|nr:DUF2220 family protein [Micrococcales bacterium]MCL2668685.1 DUF2220 family protein [Micrococcales bacterium]
MTWSTVADIRAKVQRRWDDQSLLRALAAGSPFPVITVALRGPPVAQIGDDLLAVQAWVKQLDAGARRGAHYELEHAEVGGRTFGRNRLPVRARIDGYAQAWAILGVTSQAEAFQEILALADAEPAARAWAGQHPFRALRLGETSTGTWPGLVAAYQWLTQARGSGAYVRQITAPGVDTKFVENHRGVLAQMLEVSSTAGGFVKDLGLGRKPELVRLRPAPSLGLVSSGQSSPFTELSVRRAELAELDLAPACAVVVENEVTFLSLDVPADGVLVWGKGFEVDRAGSLPWLAHVPVWYWGDLDTHGFAILDRLRTWLPHTMSFLMDAPTLLAHRERWVREDSPTRAALDHLTAEESAVYTDLVTDRYGDRIRLEQERVDWSWVREHVPYG